MIIELPGLSSDCFPLEFIRIGATQATLGCVDDGLGKYDDEETYTAIISGDYWIGKYPITQAQFDVIVRLSKYCLLPLSLFAGFSDSQNRPVDSLSWNQAIVLCDIINDLFGHTVDDDMHICLPTEAEWEVACRAGTSTPYYFGRDLSVLDDYAWHQGNSSGTTHPVGQKLPNGFGLYDVYGNVSEMCFDWYGTYPKAVVKDWQGPSSGTSKVARGGNWRASADSGQFRSSSRLEIDPKSCDPCVGVRLCMRVR